jgi:hypothetical protein
MRLAEAGGTTEGVDIEVQNATAEEIAFVQVKSRAAQAVLDDYVQVWNDDRIAQLSVQLGLGDWVAKRL